jgi:hypothetical protein
MTFTTVQNSTIFDAFYSAPQNATAKANVLAAMQDAYNRSPIARNMFDTWVNAGKTISINYTSNNAFVDRATNKLSSASWDFMKRLPTILLIAAMICAVLSRIASAQPAKTEKCPNMQHSIKIIDNSNGAIRTFEDMAASGSYPAFMQYVQAVSAHVLQTIQAMPECNGVSESATVDMVFVYTPIMLYAPLIASPHINEIKAAKKGSNFEQSSLNSPWASLTLLKNQREFRLYGTFYWNQRQFLADQVSLDGVADLTPAFPVTQDELGQYEAAYQGTQLYPHRPLKERQQKAVAMLGKKVPLDLLWLFTYSPWGGRAPFMIGVMSTMRTLEKKQLDGYITFTNALITSLFHQKELTSSYTAIKDTAAFFDVKTYPHFINGITE